MMKRPRASGTSRKARSVRVGPPTGVAALLVGLTLLLGSVVQAAADLNSISFPLVRSAGVASCLPNASGQVTVTSLGTAELMRVTVTGLPPNTEFDLFVIQLPTAPFGLTWYQGDIETNGQGRGEGTFLGRFSVETFIVAPGSGAAPVVHSTPPFPDASTNPTTAPVHTFHLGLWFGSATDAANAGCAATVTPFNGDHTAGIQVLNTSTFPNDQGPLRQLASSPTSGGLAISPASGTYATNQTFDVDLLVFAPGRSIVGKQALFDGIDVTTILNQCAVPGTLASGGLTLKCAGLRGALLGLGTHTFSVTLTLSGNLTVSDTVIWNVQAATGP